MKLVNSGRRDVFLASGSRLKPGETITVKKADGELLLRNPNMSEVKDEANKKRKKS